MKQVLRRNYYRRVLRFAICALLCLRPALATEKSASEQDGLSLKFSAYELALDKLSRQYGKNPQDVLQRMSALQAAPLSISDEALDNAFRCLAYARLEQKTQIQVQIDALSKLAKLPKSSQQNNALETARYLCQSFLSNEPAASDRALASAYHWGRQAEGAALRYWSSTAYAAMVALQGRARAAMDATKLALKIARANQDSLRLSESLRTLAGIENDFGNRQDALAHINEAIHLAQQSQLQRVEIDYSLTKVFILTLLKNYDEARTLNARLEQLCKQAELAEFELGVIGNYAELAYRQGDFKSALQFAQRALALTQDKPQGLLPAYVNATMGLSLLQIHQPELAEQHFAQAITLLRRAQRLLDLRDLYGSQAQAYAEINDYKKAYQRLQEKLKLSEEIEQESQGHDAAETRQLLELEQKEKDNLRLQEIAYASQLAEQQANVRAQTYWIIILASAFGLVLTLQLAWYLKRRNVHLLNQNQQLDRQRYLDSLTGLLNRHFYQDKQAELHQQLQSATEKGRQFVVFILDVDYFKQINDRYGHAAGDAALSEVTRCLKLSLRDTDNLLRWGGEEFVVFSELSAGMQALQLAERLRTEVEQRDWCYQQHAIALRVSIGYASLPLYWQDGTAVDLEQALRLADAALYLAKRQGRNRSVGVSAIQQQSFSREQIFNELELAWQNQQVSLQFSSNVSNIA